MTALTKNVVPLPDRLERVTRATMQRNLERPPIDFDVLDPSRVKNASELSFIVAQTAYIEMVSPRNLASVARCAPLPSVTAAFSAQIHDEIAHGKMLYTWLDRMKVDRGSHIAARFGSWAAERTQQDAWLGVANAALLTEYYASALLEELLPRVEEPCLRSIIEHIQKDEQRHKVIAVESVRAMREIGWEKRIIARALGPLVSRGTLAYFRYVFGYFLDKRAPSLEIPHLAVLDRALDESHAALARALD